MIADRYKYRIEIQQMMFVSGATSDPSPETIGLVEDIVRAQVIEIITQCSALARRRGAKSISVDDVMYLIRHDAAKVNRLSNYLSWKDVRKNTRDQEGGAVEGADLLDDPGVVNNPEPSKKLGRKQRVILPWKFPAAFHVSLPEDDDNEESDNEDDKASAAMTKRLQLADLRTKNMTKEEYVHWSECRQASFTYRKAKRFKDWLGFSHIADSRLQDDITDILGFLTFEIVANLTERALNVKECESRVRSLNGGMTQRRQLTFLFDESNKPQTPLQPEHIWEAYRKFDQPSRHNLALRTFTSGPLRYKTSLI